MITVPIEVDDDLLKIVDAQAAESGKPRSEVLAAALRRGLRDGQLSRLVAEARKGPVLSEDEAMELAKSELAAMRAGASRRMTSEQQPLRRVVLDPNVVVSAAGVEIITAREMLDCLAS